MGFCIVLQKDERKYFLLAVLPIHFLLEEDAMKYVPRIGYACMNMDTIPESFATCRINNITELRIHEMIRHNLQVLESMIDYNITNNNHLYRISSSLIPFGSSELNHVNWAEEYETDFKRIREKIEKNDIRISCHPGQYTVINSPDKSIVAASIRELSYHAQILDVLSGNAACKMVLHVGGVYGDKESAMQRFIDVYQHELPACVKKYLVIENDDRLYTLDDVLQIASIIKIPVIYDNLHHDANPSLQGVSQEILMRRVIETWKDTDGIPKVHYSQQAKDKRIGAHSETIDLDQFSADFERLYLGFPVDVMLEVKDKNRSFLKVDSLFNYSQRRMEREWACYKYLVMSKSQRTYNELRRMFKDGDVLDVQEFYSLIDSCLSLPETKQSQINAMQHVWGYFKKVASEKEKQQFLLKLDKYSLDEVKAVTVLRYLRKLADVYDVVYLKSCYYLKV